MPAKHFSVDARAMLTWGRQSIRDHTTAVVELVKNGYDAGSAIVEIEILASSSPDDFIRISDAGEGMSERDLDECWLRIGYSAKREQTTTAAGRRRTGEKGIGRISADRLGEVLELRTQRKRQDPCGLIVDWSAFEESGREIDTVDIQPIETPSLNVPAPSQFDEEQGEYRSPPKPKPNSRTRSGTELLIKRLRDRWAAADIHELHTALSVLTPPFGGVEDFQIRLTNDIVPELSGVVQSPFFKMSEIEVEVAIDGAARISCSYSGRDRDGKRLQKDTASFDWNEFIHLARLRHDDQSDSSVEGQLPRFGPARVVLLFYPRSSETLRGTELLLSDLREFLNQNAGVKVYRDQIRVAPYGDPTKPEGDWLGLGDRKARNPAGPSRSDYRIAPNQLVGAIFLGRDENEAIADTSSREGLIHNDAFHEFNAFVMGCIVQLESYYHKLFVERRGPKLVENPTKQVTVLSGQLKSLAEDLEKAKEDMPIGRSRRLDRAVDRLTETRSFIETAERSIDELASQATIYRSLATLGIAAGTFGHETLGSIEGAEFAIKEAVDELSTEEPDLDSVLEELEKSLKFTARISAWGKFALGRVRRDKRRRRTRNVAEIVRELIVEVDVPFGGSSIVIRKSLRRTEGRVFPMDVEAILLNLLTNAYFFCKQSPRKRVIRVECRARSHEERNGFLLTVADSGPGVPRARRDQIWDPLFTTKVDPRGRDVGTGLGLTIVESIVQDSGGWRTVEKDEELRGASFEVWLPFG